MSRALDWMGEPKRQPWINTGLLVAVVVGAVLFAYTTVNLGRVKSEQAAQRTATQVVIQGRCDQLRSQLDPSAPAPSTPLGRYNLGGYQVEFDRLHCSSVPPLVPPKP